MSELGPDTTDTRQYSLASESSLGTDLTGEVCNLTGEILELVDHFVDCTFEGSDFRVTLFGADENFLAEITIGNSSNDAADFAENFLVGGIYLLVL